MRGLVASFVCIAALAACGGKVIVDQPSSPSGGNGGAGGTAATSGGSPTTTGGGGSVCAQAIAHLEMCIPGGSTSSGPMNCMGANECQAECAINAPCSAFTGADMQATKAFEKCAEQCGH